MDNLLDVTRREVFKYAGNGHGAGLRLYTLSDDTDYVYAVNALHLHPKSDKKHGIVVMARIENEHIIIEVDNTDKPLIDALLQQGIPRARIILAYRGENFPQPITSTGD